MATLSINLQALCNNYQVLKRLAPKSKILAVVKSNAYGHGFLQVSQALSAMEDGLDGFSVARIDEALHLRQQGFQQKIVLLEGVFNADDLQLAYEHDVTLVLHTQEQCQLVSELVWHENRDLKVWIKVNTGMNRLGFNKEELEDVHKFLDNSPRVHAEVLMTHLANADSGSLEEQRDVLANFECAKKILPNIAEYSVANSAAIICYKETHAHWNRPGIALYGATALQDNEENADRLKSLSLEPVMNFSAPVLAVNAIPAGASVGYGSTWTAQKDTRVAVVGVGYGDGYPRSAKQGTPIAIGGKLYPLIGRVSMDMLTVEVGDAHIKMGDRALLWGKQVAVEGGVSISADHVARFSSTISYDLFCGISSRVKREYSNGEK